MSVRFCRDARILLVLGGILLLAMANPASAAVLGWWKMDDANYPSGHFDTPTSPDLSGNGNGARPYGDVAVGTTTGQSGNSVLINDSGALDCGMDASLKPSGSAGYTFATWVKFNDLTPYWQMIGTDWNDDGAAGSKFFFHLATQDDVMNVYLADPGSDDIYLGATDTTPMAADAWTHVAFTITPGDGMFVQGEVKLYRNGELVGDGVYTPTSLPVTTEPLILGAKTNAGIFSLMGELDETAVWTSAITASDVAALASGTSPGAISTSTLGGYWQFENPVPPPNTATVTDSSGLSHDGVMTPEGVDPFHPSDGRFGGAVRLSAGYDAIAIDDIDGITEELTISTWIKPDDVDGLQVVNSHWNDGDQADKAWQILMIGDTAHFYVSQPGGGIYAPVNVTAIAPGEWTNLTFTMKANDGTTTGKIQAYKDGTLVGEADYDMDSLPDSSVPLVIGNRAYLHNPDQNFNGLVDDMALFDEALSASQIALLYTDGVAALITEIPGDANGDQMVNNIDAEALATHWGTTAGASRSMGDFNGDGAVDMKDASILAANWNYGVPAAEGNPVPEPSMLLTVLAGLLSLSWVRRRRIA